VSDLITIGDEELLRIHRHFINLTCLDEGPHARKECGGQPKRYNFSAVAVEIDGVPLAITAGHVIADLERAIKAGAVITHWAIDDSIVMNHGHEPYPISLDFDRDVTHVDAGGLDFAVFRFDPIARRALEGSAIIPADETIWDTDDIPEFPFWILVGTPVDLATLPASGVVEKNHVSIAVQQLHARPEGLEETVFPRLYGRLDFESVDGTAKFDIGGMSGGPIFAFRHPPQGAVYDYRLLGIQSSWDGKNIAFFPLQQFLRANGQLLLNGPA